MHSQVIFTLPHFLLGSKARFFFLQTHLKPILDTDFYIYIVIIRLNLNVLFNLIFDTLLLS